MAIQNRSTTLPEIWAKNAQTTIPTPPVAGITYRNQALNSTAIDKAWPYKEIVDSANFNQHAYLQDMLIKEAEQYGVMRWNNTTTYKQGGFCLAQDGNLYQAKRDNVNKEPTANSSDWGKYPELSAYQLKSNLVQTLSQATDKYPSAKAVQDAVNTKQATITGGASTIATANLTANRALMSNSSGKVEVSAVTSTELGYLDGVTSGIQSQLNGKQTTANLSQTIDTSTTKYPSNNAVKTAIANINLSGYAKTDLSNVSTAGKSASVSWGTPNYAAGIQKNSGFTSDKAGLVLIIANVNDVVAAHVLKINGTVIFNNRWGASYLNGLVTHTIPVPAGTKIEYTSPTTVKIMFYPFKGV